MSVGPDQTVEVDLCTTCGGLFLEFFDGEPSLLADGVLAINVDAPPAPATDDEAPATCPDCRVKMRRTRYMQEEAGPLVYRCDACMAVFANHWQARELAAYLPYVFGSDEGEE